MRMRFILSGCVALSIQILVYTLILVFLLPKAQQQYTFQNRTAIDLIEIEEFIQKPSQKMPQSTKESDLKDHLSNTPKDSKIQESIPKPSPVAGSDIRKLFERIDSSNPPVLKDNIEDERPKFSANAMKQQNYSFDQNDSLIQAESSKIKRAFDLLGESDLEIKAPQNQDLSEGEYNEWFALVKEILYAKWENVFYESIVFVIKATIGADGSFDYRVIRSSKHQFYNAYMEEMLNSLKNEKFPPYPKGRITLEVVFKTKEHQ